MALLRIPEQLPPAGLAIAVNEIRCSLRMLGFIPGNTHNSLNPKLTVLADGIEIKVLQTGYHAYSAFEEVSYKPASFWHQARVELKLRSGDVTEYTIETTMESMAKELARFFHTQGVPLSAETQQALTQS